MEENSFPLDGQQIVLAERLGLKEQQIQRYEATEYASANLARVIEVSETLGLKFEIKGNLEISSSLPP